MATGATTETTETAVNIVITETSVITVTVGTAVDAEGRETPCSRVDGRDIGY